MKFLEQFEKLLDSLKSGGMITESVHAQMMTEAKQVIKEESGDIGETIKKAISDALGQQTEQYKKTIEDLQRELDEAKKGKKKDAEPEAEKESEAAKKEKEEAEKNAGENLPPEKPAGDGKPEEKGDEKPEGDENLPPETPEGEEQEEGGEQEKPMIPISDALTLFAGEWSEEALEYFTELSETFTDDQEAIIKSLLALEMPDPFQADEEDTEEEEQEEGGEKDDLDDLENEFDADKTDKTDGEVTTFESLQKKNLMSEKKSTKLEGLYLKKQKMEEALLDKQVKALGKQNRKFKMTAGVLGQTDRTNYFGNIVRDMSRKLAFAEAAAKTEKEERLALDERLAETMKENDRVIAENRALKLEKKTLVEKVDSTNKTLILSEAKAYLVEQSRGLNEPMKQYLFTEMKGRSPEYIKQHLNEAIDAFDRGETKRRTAILSERQPSDRTGKNLVVEDVEQQQNNDEGTDPAVAAITAMCGTFSTNFKR